MAEAMSKSLSQSTPKSIFIAFTGPDYGQPEGVIEISPGYECWNLKKFTVDSFVSALTGRIPPLNDNVLRNYRAPDSEPTPDFGIRQSDYEHCSWGLLLPSPTVESFGGYGETLLLLNLYSPHFMRPIFWATDFGIMRPQQPKDRRLFFHDQNQAQRFSKKAFAEFHKTLVSESVYSVWQADRVAHWQKEDWRLFVACQLFSEQHQYENSKQTFGWQRESADLATILEALFTAGDDDTAEVTYKLRKRIAVLLSPHMPEIEKDIKDLYAQRSAFVHGSFFRHISKETKVTQGMAELPHPPFDFLYKQKEHVRWALVSYLHLNKVYRADPDSFPGCKNVLQILEEAIIDTKLRSTVSAYTSKILSLL
jgi:hypothetical protein